MTKKGGKVAIEVDQSWLPILDLQFILQCLHMIFVVELGGPADDLLFLITPPPIISVSDSIFPSFQPL